VAGQNFGARQGHRVRQTFKSAALMATTAMVAAALLLQLAPETAVRFFSTDAQVVATGAEYLRIISWNFVASGVIFVSSSMFQAMGNTLPSLLTSFARILIVAIPLVILSRMPGFELRWVWHLSVASVLIQMCLNLLLLKREFRLRLTFAAT
jgi:Na+-driven multidrug efflux pump